MKPPRILVAGIGNIFLCDDGFGCEVVQELSREPLPPGVVARDFGIRSYDLAYALVEGFDAVIFVDTTPRGKPPGTLCVLELDHPGAADTAVSGHSLDPLTAIRLAGTLGVVCSKLYLVGCEPGILESDDGRIGLSEIVHAATPDAVKLIRTLLHQLLAPEAPKTAGTAFAGPNQGNSHECLGDSWNHRRDPRASGARQDVPGNTPLPANA
ncbi:MAG: hybD [Verrucomicrobia bacterium]|nr:hybD [Verrucomicrobiota bacterium]